MKTLFPPEPPETPALNLTTSGSRGEAHPEEWKLILLELQSTLEEEAYRHWIEPLKCYAAGPQEITLLVPDLISYQGLRTEFLGKIESCKKRLGFDALAIKIGFDESQSLDKPKSSYLRERDLSREHKAPANFDEEPLVELQEPASPPKPAGEEEGLSPELSSDEVQGEAPPLFLSSLSQNARLNPHYLFETFVKGPSNQFALASCLNVAEKPGISYNPLFLYGSTGLGKTHLLHAVGNHVRQSFPNLVVAYISTERFMNEMIFCIRHNKMWDFRQKYRHCDVFMMDDIQFISGNKAATQEEFFHTFNTLYEAKKQIIITSDLFPQDIPDIEERLRNRFQWGLIADIQPPDVEHRIAILMSKAEQLKVLLSQEVAEYIATHAKRNVRELEGALHRIAAFAALQGRPLDKAIAMETFHSVVGETPKQIEIEVVQKAVANHFKLRLTDLRSQKRQRILTLPRQVAMYLARKHTQASFPDIGKKFGGKDHTTVMHAVKKIAQEKNKDLDLKAHIEALERQLEQIQLQQ